MEQLAEASQSTGYSGWSARLVSQARGFCVGVSRVQRQFALLIVLER
jgi:hypothetical protein